MTLLCALLAVLQNRWLGEVSRAERGRLHDQLRSELMNLSRTFSHEVEDALRSTAQSGQPGAVFRTAQIVNSPPVRDRGKLQYRLKDDIWVVAELNPDWVRATLSGLATTPGLADFEIQVITKDPTPALIFTTGPEQILDTLDASVSILDIQGDGPGRGRGPRGPDFLPGPPPNPFRGPPDPPGLWRIQAIHRNGSLEALVETTQRRNLAVSGALLLLILAIAIVLVRLTRQAQLLADAHIGFVAGVSHELRTPLTVIRTAGFNLAGGKLHSRPEQIERYGRLIAAESEKLEGLVDQVLRFAGGLSGQVIDERRSVDLSPLLREAAAAAAGTVHLQIEPRLPPALADERALRHAVRNLLDNAVRYGRQDVALAARQTTHKGRKFIEIEVSDKGPGIPSSEIGRIFEPFFRGARPRLDQIHGTGLGLNIVKTIVEAHGGGARVTSAPGQGTHFFIQIPCAGNQIVTNAHTAD